MTPRTHFPLRIELLESRLAPAVVIGRWAHGHLHGCRWRQSDRRRLDRHPDGRPVHHRSPRGVGEQLQKIDFSGGGFDNANITFSVAKVAGGDGLANVGYINSTGHDLGTVSVAGDLGQIDAGDGTPAAPAVKSLTVRTMGQFGTDTQVAGGSLESDLNGALGCALRQGRPGWCVPQRDRRDGRDHRINSYRRIPGRRVDYGQRCDSEFRQHRINYGRPRCSGWGRYLQRLHL